MVVQAKNQVMMECQMTLNRACQCKTLLRLSPKRWKETSYTAKNGTQPRTFPPSSMEDARTTKGSPPTYVRCQVHPTQQAGAWGLAHHNRETFPRQAISERCFRPRLHVARFSLEARWLLPASTHVDSQGTLPTGSRLFGQRHLGLIYGRKPPYPQFFTSPDSAFRQHSWI